MAEFYSARSWEIPPLPWTNLSPPFSGLSYKRRATTGVMPFWAPWTLLLAVAQPLPALAAESRLALDYDVFVGGLHAVKLEAGLSLEPDAYSVDITFETTGWIGRILPWSMRSRAEGRLDTVRARPKKVKSVSKWNGKARSIALDYRDDGRIIARFDPPPETDEREPVPDALRRDTVDLPSALLTVLRAIARGGECSQAVPVFDGRRRYDFLMEPAGAETLAASSYSPFAGTATICNARIIRIKGFQNYPHQQDRWDDYKREARVWIAPVFEGVLPAPVRIEIDTPFGSIRAHLADARLESGGTKQSLARAAHPARPERPVKHILAGAEGAKARATTNALNP